MPVDPSVPSPQIWVRLNQAQAWIRVTATLLVIAGLVSIGVGGMAWGTVFLHVPEIGQTMVALAIFFGCLFLIPAILLFRYAMQIRIAAETKAVGALVAAFRAQHRLWTFATATLILYLAFVVISWILRRSL